MDAHLSKEKKPRAKKLAFHYESYTRKSKFLEQSGGGGGGGWVCQPIKVMRTRGYPKAAAEDIFPLSSNVMRLMSS